MVWSHRRMIWTLAIVSSCGGKTDVSPSVADGGMAGHAGWSSVVCMHGDEPIALGKAYSDGCNTCTCGATGAFECSQIDCNTGCFLGSVWLKLGESAANPSDGGTCTCTAIKVVCTAIPFGTSCVYRGMTYASGQDFIDSDGCSACSCLSGTVTCSHANCTSGCNYAGAFYPEGAQFPSPDGCNQCVCTGSLVACTANLCPCNPQREYYRNYITFEANQCMNIAISCAKGTEPFTNDCGCGCEQSLSCPQYFDCSPQPNLLPPCPTPEQQAACPLSTAKF